MKNKIIVISSYPERLKTHGDKTVGVASYTKNLLKNLRRLNKKIYFEVLAEKLNKKEKYYENGIFINRLWKRNSIQSILRLMIFVLNKKEKIILIPIEYYMFGGFIQNVFFLFLILIWKLLGKKQIIIIIHQVLKEFAFFYLPLINISDKVIVFEQKFKNILKNKKVYFIPHAVENRIFKYKLNKKNKKNLSCLFFGYISPYKGIKEILNLWENKFGNLVIAGGLNPNHKKNKKYLEYAKDIKSLGFINEKKISKYFLENDLIIFPYKKFFSSSGPLSLSFSFEKPFILSRSLIGYFESPDFQEALKQTGLKKEDFIFDFNKKSLEFRLNWAKKNLDKLSLFAKIMKEKRSWKKIGKKYLELLN